MAVDPVPHDVKLAIAIVGTRWRWIERIAWITGFAALSVWGGSVLVRHTSAARELKQFETTRDLSRTATIKISYGAPDTRLWDPKRILEWQATQKDNSPPPLAVLRIARLGIEAPVLEGTDDWTLNRGVGHIDDTAAPDGAGNVGIAGHRDGFFRALKDIAQGDTMELETKAGVARYSVERVWIVSPDDVTVLDPTPSPSITLVTCYPFYFVGSAPQRFIVRGVRTGELSARAARN